MIWRASVTAPRSKFAEASSCLVLAGSALLMLCLSLDRDIVLSLGGVGEGLGSGEFPWMEDMKNVRSYVL